MRFARAHRHVQKYQTTTRSSDGKSYRGLWTQPQCPGDSGEDQTSEAASLSGMPERPARGVRRLSLRSRLVLLVVASIIPLTAFTLARRYFDYQEAVENAGQKTLALARGLSIAVEKDLQARIAALQVLALSQALRDGDLVAFRAQAEAVAGQFPVSNIVLLKDDGRQLMNTLLPPGAPLPVRPDAAAARQVYATDRPAVSDVYRPALGTNRYLVSIAVPGKAPDASVVSVLSISPRSV